MLDEPLVSIIIPVLNGASTIQRTIDSIKAQDYPNIEIIVMDAVSTDDTIAILKANASDLRWYSELDKGQSDAINKGVAHAKGANRRFLVCGENS